MIMERCWDAGKPGKRPWFGRCEFWETPVEDGGHVSRGAEVSSTGGNLQVEEWVLAGLRSQGEQVCPQGRPGRLVGEVGHDLVGSAVEHLNDLGANQLLGRRPEPVGVALNGVEQPGSRVTEFSQQCRGRDGGLVTSEDLLQGLGWSAGCDGVRSDEVVRVTVADNLQVEVVGRPSAGEHRVELLP
jgi:hypothetical protein